MADRPGDLDPLARLSARLGNDPTLIQGPGGNTSIKLGNRLWVKASGTWLADALSRPIFLPLDLAGVRRRFGAGEEDPASPEVLIAEHSPDLRPSIETTMHAVVPHRVVLHVHSVNAIARAVRPDGANALSAPLRGLRWAWIPYAKPGVPLTRSLRNAAEGGADVLVLANHGLVVAADGVEKAADLLYEVEARLRAPLRQAPRAEQIVLQELTRAGGYRLPLFGEAHAVAMTPKNVEIATRGALYPDHVIFLGPSPTPAVSGAEAARQITAFSHRGKDGPPFIIIPGAGVLLRSDLGRSADEMARCLALVLARIDHDASIAFLTPDQEAELLDWPAEKHRQALAATRDQD